MKRTLLLSLLFAAVVVGSLAKAQRIITTVAGSARVVRGDGGPATSASLDSPEGLAVDAAGNLFIADRDNDHIRQVGPDGVMRTVAGNGIRGFSGDGGPATKASLAKPDGLALDAAGNLFIADTLNFRIRRVSPDGIISTVAGNGIRGFSGDGGPATNARLSVPQAVAVDAAGNLFIADVGSHRIRQVSPDGIISTVAGNGIRGLAGDGGPATNASLANPDGLAVDAAGNLFIADSSNHRIRRVSVDGVISKVAGSEFGGFFAGDGGPASDAALALPTGLALDTAGNLFIADTLNFRIRRISPDGIISTVAGNGTERFAGDGFAATGASLVRAQAVAVDAAGNLFIADTFNHRIRRVSVDGVIGTVAGNGSGGFSGDGGPATNAALSVPTGLALDTAGNLFVADTFNDRIRQVSPDGIISTVAGNGIGDHSGDGGPATNASIVFPDDLAVDGVGNLFIADFGNSRIRRVGPDGVIGTVAGNGSGGFSGDGGPATNAPLVGPRGVAVDGVGNLFIADTFNHRIRRVSPDGIISTVAGNGIRGFSGDGGPATNASLASPDGVAVDGVGNLFIADRSNHRIRRVSGDGVISTVAGSGVRGFSGDGGPATNAPLAGPTGLALDTAGNLFIADRSNHRIRRVSPDGIISTVAGNGTERFSGDGGPATNASLAFPDGLAVDAAGNLFIADRDNDRIRVVLAEPLRFSELSLREATLAARSGAAPVEAESVLIVASVVNLPSLNALPQVSFSASTDAPWLTVSPPVGMTPRLLRIQADPAELALGDYQGLVTVTMPDAQPAQQVISVSFAVGAPLAPKLSVDAEAFSFTYSSNAAARSDSFLVLNQGGGELPFAVTTETDSGGDWLIVQPGSRRAAPNDPVTVEVQADPHGLPPGTYTGRVRVEAEAEGSPAVTTVTMTISAQDQAILLTQRGLSFTAVEHGGLVPPQTVGVTNLGRGSMSWNVTTCTLTEFSCDWLRVNPDSGESDPISEVPQVTVTVDQDGLQPGVYYGLVEVRASEAANTPHVLTVFLEVLPTGSDPGAALTNNELIFTYVSGGGSPSSQDIFVYNVAAAPKSYRSSRSIDAGRLEILPEDGVLDPRDPTRVVVQPFGGSTPPGEYDGNVTLQFSDGRVQELGLKVVVTDADQANSLHGLTKSQGLCSPTRLLPAMKTLGDNFSISGGWPVGLQVEVTDDCGRPQTEGSVVIEFSNGDPQIAMKSLRNGRWDGTWQTNPRTLSDVTVSVKASMPSLGLQGAREVRGGLRAIQQAPVVPQAGVVGAASPVSHQPLAPGSLISVFGLGLSDGRGVADRLPLPEVLQSTSLFLAGIPMPLLFTSDGQVNAMIPYGLAINTNHQIVVQRGPTLSWPAPVNLAAAQPAVFRTTPDGTQGHIYRVLDGVQILADAASPAGPVDVLVMYCSGLGEVDPAVEAGLPAGASPLSRTVHELTVMIGGQQAQVLFSGLAPGFSGLYQVNVLVKESTGSDPEVPVTLVIAGQTSRQVTMAVR